MQRPRRLAAAASTVAAGALLLAACGGSASAKGSTSSTSAKSGSASTTTVASGKPTYGGTVKFAEVSGGDPNYIFPVTPTQYQSVYVNDDFIPLMWAPLYNESTTQPVIDYSTSIGQKPVFSSGNTVVTITMNHYKWSDGKPVTARDVIFDYNMINAEGSTWGGYSPGGFPQMVKSFTATGQYTLKMVLNKPYNPTYFINNDLADLIPLPQHAWDKTSASAPVSNADMTPAGAKAVMTFLTTAAKNTGAYTTSPLWKVIDGAWKLTSYGGSSAPDVFVPNPAFSGKKPYLSKFEEVPFTSDSAEFNVLRSGTSSLSYGYLPANDIPAMAQVNSQGFKTYKIYTWGVDYFIPNLTSPTVGPMLKQLYMRQVLQHLVNQQTDIKAYMHGYGIPTYGPTPVYPKGNPYVTKKELANPYPFSVSTAESLLKKHGWTVKPNGTDVCKVGGASGCGAGVAAGTKLSLSLLVSSGNSVLTNDNDQFKSDAAKAGVTINLKFEPFNTVIGIVNPCNPATGASSTACSWQLGEYGGISYGIEPTGGSLFLPGGSLNAGSYSNSTVTSLIKQIRHSSSGLQPYFEYEDYLATDLPWIWQPVPDNLAEVASNLHGTGIGGEFNGVISGNLQPQLWYYSKTK